MKKVSALALSVAISLGLAGCGKQEAQQTTVKTEAPKPVVQSGIEKENFDTHVRFQDDFYYSVNGHWLKNTPIPGDKSNYGAFSVLYEKSQDALKKIIEETAKQPNKVDGSSAQKVGDFYASYMNTDKIKELGITPLNGLLSEINSAKTHKDIAAVMGKLMINGGGIPFGFYVNNDAKKSDQYAVYFYQSGLTLPDRDYYLKDDEKFANNRKQMQQYITDLLTQAGVKDADKAAENVMKMETFIAKNQWSRVQSRDANARYNKMDRKQLNSLFGNVDFEAFAKNVGIGSNVKEVIVSQPSYFEALGKQFDKFSVDAWKDYLSFHLVDNYAELLTPEFANLSFEFHDKALQGIQEQKPRWKQAVDAANNVIGELVGQQYVKEHFKPEAKERMEGLIKNLIKGFEVSINELEWMTPETKKAAQEKLSKFTYKIGYPDKWKDYTGLTIKGDDLVGNYLRYTQFEYKDMLGKLGQPIDKTQWFMTPQTVNAYYNPVMNEIVFPAAILQPPFFNMEADDAVNYGGIGAVIGHEISHGFDDQGAKYDGDGNLRDWWTAKDKEEFQKRGKALSEQYSKYEALPGKFVNGDLTLGENIGDLGGLTVAYRSYLMSLNGKPSPVIDGFTGEQRVFIGWSQVWRRNYRDEELAKRLLTDSHSPSHFRAMGTPRNIPEFYKAFEVKDTDKMYLPEDKRVKIW
ncbi:M13 family peptidase [Parashewanella curva]|uniref:M13 family peptidase n=1 Tax=Parashewanella curva TaxID=2338552 RepID=A0A3L8PTI5_9GAMM|nr:M13-type metalloendopeptidase [Parashewanella curva]RLV58604.1 M13 family peptidase [Parashewanella curva]